MPSAPAAPSRAPTRSLRACCSRRRRRAPAPCPCASATTSSTTRTRSSARQRRRFAGRAARHEEVDAGVDLPPRQPRARPLRRASRPRVNGVTSAVPHPVNGSSHLIVLRSSFRQSDSRSAARLFATSMLLQTPSTSPSRTSPVRPWTQRAACERAAGEAGAVARLCVSVIVSEAASKPTRVRAGNRRRRASTTIDRPIVSRASRSRRFERQRRARRRIASSPRGAPRGSSAPNSGCAAISSAEPARSTARNTLTPIAKFGAATTPIARRGVARTRRFLRRPARRADHDADAPRRARRRDVRRHGARRPRNRSPRRPPASRRRRRRARSTRPGDLEAVLGASASTSRPIRPCPTAVRQALLIDLRTVRARRLRAKNSRVQVRHRGGQIGFAAARS